jgi:hypothetical protein
MKRILLVFCVLFAAVKGFSQQFSQYNTGTLYDSFENPSQRSFIPDTSKQYASNFFIPNLNANLFLTGDAQSTVVSRIFGGKYNNTALQIGPGNINNAHVNANVYAFMLKDFISLNGDVEMGFFAEARAEGRGSVTDESVALLNGPAAFANNTYDNIFNNHYYYQTYDAIGISYREKINKQVSFGIKLSALLGIQYTKLNIDESHINFDGFNDAAVLSLRGKYYFSQGPGKLDSRSFLPTTRSPGAQISIGTSYRTDDGITFQGNIKDLGFIHWYSNSTVYNFDGSGTIMGLSSTKREDNIYNTMIDIARSGATTGSFTSPTDGKFELSATKTYYLDDDKEFKYYPTLIASKELFYNGYTGAMVNRFQYKNYNVSLTGSYDNLNLFGFGMQFMIKSNNLEFFIGSERLFQTVSLAMASGNSSSYTNGSYTGADFFMGFALKFGQVIEHPLNSSTMPNGEKGFFGRLYNRLFKTNW